MAYVYMVGNLDLVELGNKIAISDRIESADIRKGKGELNNRIDALKKSNR